MRLSALGEEDNNNNLLNNLNMIKYSLVMRGEPRHPERPKRAFASAQCIKTLSLEEVARHIRAHGCAYSTGDFIAITKMLAEATAKLLKEGYQVELDDLGKFYITLGCEGVESMEAFQPDRHIKEVRVNWAPGEAFGNMREGVNFEESLKRHTERKLLRAERNGDSILEL